MSSPDQSPPLHGSESAATSDEPPMRHQPYDYKNSSLESDRKAALEVEKRLLESRRAKKEHAKAESDDRREDDAAKLLQGTYRSHSALRTANGMNLSSSDRWSDGLRQHRMSAAGKEQDEGKNDAPSRWKRGGLYAEKISEGGKKGTDAADMTAEEEMDTLAKNDKERKQIAEERHASKQMEAQYWLEMVDSKHRYGANLKWYHQKWNETETSDNFFHWLDEGDGKTLDLKQCPRARLEKEQIIYLNAQQRMNYKVVVDQGRLVWAHNKEPLDTTKAHRDAGPDVGIVPMTDEEVKEKAEKDRAMKKARAKNGGETPSDSSSDESDDGVAGYSDKGGTAGQGKGFKQVKARLDYYLSPRAVMDRLLRDTIANNTWLYVADMKNNLYVGIKQTGRFQHSSLLGGSRVTSAGLIKADKGTLTSLSPLSGHYRAGTMHFKTFVRSLDEQQCDMSRLSISTALATIGAIEKYGAASKKKAAFKEKVKVTLGLAKPAAEEKKTEDAKDVAQIKSDAATGKGVDADSEAPPDPEAGDTLQGPLPSDRKKIEEMTDDERMERGVALLQRAMMRTWERRSEEGSHGGKDQKEGDDDE